MNLSQEFKNYLFSQEVKPSRVTVKNYLSDINHFTRWFEKSFQKPFSSSEVTKQVIENYKIESLESFSASSVERHLSSLRKLFIFLKLEGKIPYSPFEQIKSEATSEADPWHIKDFKSYLYVFNASHLTIKNYLIDIKQFLNWAEEVTRLDSVDPRRAGSNVLNKIDSKLIEEYKQRLLTQAKFSPATINRKLSSLRKYTLWATEEGLLKAFEIETQNIASEQPKIRSLEVQALAFTQLQSTEKEKSGKEYSSFPPLRLLQKVTKAINLAIDATLITQLVKIIEKVEYALWKIKGQPVFKRFKLSDLKLQKLNLTSYILNHKPFEVKNIKKELYAPLDISTKYFPWYKKTWFTLRYKRPNWYKTYHSYAIVHYFHFAVLVIFAAGLAFGFYQGFFADQGKSPALAVLPTAPPRILSFQGRLTDNNDNPITANTNLRFAIYNNLTASGSALLWQEIDNIAPDVDGIFNVLLGNNTGIPSTLFSQNNALFLGVTVENTPELTPRQQLATVAFASNSETLQGLLPITAGGAGTTNVVLALDSSGNLTIGGSATPTFQASGGQLTLSGQALLLTTNAGSNGNIQLAPDGFGLIDLTKPLVNTSNSNNISTAGGAVEVDDLFAILASSSGQSALSINQTGTGPLISASASGVAKFTVDNSGNITAAGNGAISGTLTLSSSSPLAFTGTTPITITQTNGSTINWTDGTNNLLQIIDNGANGTLNVTGSYQINGTSGASVSNACVNATGGIITSAGTCPASASGNDLYWNQQNGALFPNNSTVDLLIGGQATGSAKFAFLNVNSGTPTFKAFDSSMAKSVNIYHDGTNGNVETSSGNLNLGTSGGSVYIDTQIVNDTTTNTGFVKIADKLLVQNSESAGNALAIFDNTGAGDILTASASSQTRFTILNNGTLRANTYATCTLKTDATGLFTCGTDAGEGTFASPFRELSGAIVPLNSTLDFFIGGQATTSAKFAILNVNGARGTQIASLSGSLTLDSSTASIQTTNNQLLTIGGNTTGDIQFKPGNSSTSLYLQSGGNVGIGTTTPQAILHVNGGNTGGNAALIVNQTGNSANDIITASASGITKFRVTNSGTIYGASLVDIDNTSYFLDPAAIGTSLNVAGNIITTGTGTAVQAGFWTRNTTSGYLYPSTLTDNVGIGDTTPDAFFDVEGISVFGSGATNGGATINTGNTTVDYPGNSGWCCTLTSNILLSGLNNTSIAFHDAGATIGTFGYTNNQFYVDGAGSWGPVKFGINTRTPAGTLNLSEATGVVHGPSQGSFIIDHENSGGASSIVFRSKVNRGSDYGFIQYQDAATVGGGGEAAQLIIGTSNDADDHLILQPSGNVGIGTTAPLSKLSVGGAGISGTAIYGDSSSSGSDVGVRGNSNSNIGVIGSGLSGVWGFGTGGQGGYFTSTSGFALQTGTGDARFGGYVFVGAYLNIALLTSDSPGGSLCKRSYDNYVGLCSSLREFKDNITPLGLGLDTLMKLSPVTYNWKQPVGSDTIYHDLGFVAEDVEAINPLLATYDKGKLIGVKYEHMTALIVKSIQEQQGQIASLSGQLTQLYLTDTGDLNFVDNTITADANFIVPHYYSLNDILGNPIDRIGAFKELAVANLRAGLVDAQQISTNALSVTTENITIQGQSLRNYIASIVTDIINSTNNNVISPIASIDTLNTNLISPIGNDSRIALKLENDKLSILNSKFSTGSAVTTFDNAGNATFSGQISANQLSIRGNLDASDASISGTLRAGKILASDIEGLNINTATLSANYITNNYYASASSEQNIAYSFPTLTASPSGNNNYISVEPFASQFAYIENLSGANAAFNQGLMVFGPTTLSDTSVVGQLSVNGNFIIADNSINVLGADLNLQPLRQGGLSIMAGLIYIDTNGNVTFEKDATVKGTLYANAISSLPGLDLTLKLASGSSQIQDTKYKIQDTNGLDVLSINQLGDLIASGAGTFNKLNLGLVTPALAVSPTEVIATGSAGTVTLKANKTQVTVLNNLVTEKSLIYITPVGQTLGQSLYLLRQIPDESFTVGISVPMPTDIKFNFLIIN